MNESASYWYARAQDLEAQAKQDVAQLAAMCNAVVRMQEALEDIFANSQDNWAAARAETGLGRGKIAVLSCDDSSKEKS